MIQLRRSADRGHAEHGWLEARHSFSFSEYYDRRWMGYSNLRVINEDRVAPGTGFATHGHRDMEIITYPLSGAVRHQDSTGGSGLIRHGELQVMHAGSGIRHSEMNGSYSEPLHLLQIWIEPNQMGVKPGYEQSALDRETLSQGFVRAVAPAAEVGAESAAFHIHADAGLSLAWPKAGDSIHQPLRAGRRHYLHLARGEVKLGEQTLSSGDAALIEDEAALDLVVGADSELLLFDLP